MGSDRDLLVVTVERDLAVPLLHSILSIAVFAFITFTFIRIINNPIATYIAMIIWGAGLILLIRWIQLTVERNRALREFSERLKISGLSLPPGELLELHRATIKGEIRTTTATVSISIGGGARRHSTTRYITTKSFEKISEVFAGYDLRELGVSNILAIFPTGEGFFDGKILRIAGGRYKDIIIIPITPRITNHKVIEERVGDDDELCIYRLEFIGCKVIGSIAPLMIKRARSYRVEMRAGEEISGSFIGKTPLKIYSGGAGSFETELPICKHLIIVVHEKMLNMRDIARKVKNTLGGERTIFIGYRENTYTIRLVIDRPLAKDLVKEISL
ncbi:MAG TPA: hypothetical protein VNL13_04440 [Sulfolobales archaeon]|nr:hypothetical protein [Sulfolobales archaeon]